MVINECFCFLFACFIRLLLKVIVCIRTLTATFPPHRAQQVGQWEDRAPLQRLLYMHHFVRHGAIQTGFILRKNAAAYRHRIHFAKRMALQ